LLLYNFKLLALEFEPGIGVGLEYTDNATLSADNQLDDLIAVGYIGAILREDDGPLQADITASLNHHRYTKDTFKDLRYFNLAATADWEMIKNRFDWILRNVYRQRPINSADPNTPDNIQDSNAFTFGANILYPISARQIFTLFPEYRNFYYEIQSTDNQQFSLAASWNYDIDNVSSAGWDASVRTVVYDEPVINDVNFGNISFTFSNIRARSNISTRLGSTYVQRENGQGTVEFAGNLNWLVDLTSRSRIRTFIASDLTDSSNGALNATLDPEVGDSNDIQITTDVIRSQVISLGYLRQDGTFDSSLTGQLRNLNYSESPNDRRIWNVNADFGYQITALLSSGFYGRYSNTDFLDTGRIDNNFTIGGGIGYRLSRKLSSRLDIKYRNRDSTSDSQNFTEWSVYASLTYGFGEPMRPTRSAGF
jgi:hypothetical protein